MVRHSFAPVVLLLTALNLLFLQTHSTPLATHQKRGICGTEHPDPAFLDAVHNVRVDESNSNATDSEARGGPIEIETWFHIVSSKAEAGQVSDDMINSQVSWLLLLLLCSPPFTLPARARAREDEGRRIMQPVSQY